MGGRTWIESICMGREAGGGHWGGGLTYGVEEDMLDTIVDIKMMFTCMVTDWMA